MKRIRSLKTNILYSFLIIIAVIGVFKAAVNYFVVKYYIIERAKKQVQNDLKIAHLIYQNQLTMMRQSFIMAEPEDNIKRLKTKLKLDYILLLKNKDIAGSKSEIVKRAMETKLGIGGTRIIEKDELCLFSDILLKRVTINVRDTLKSMPSNEKVLEKAMALEYAEPLYDLKNNFRGILVGGKILNGDLSLIDTIHHYVFEDRMMDNKPIGTVTIFLNDVRIATNVLDENGKRAIGTKVSETVYRNVLEKGKTWVDRAFVVTDWYLTGYEPIRNINDKIIGILYVGTLEKPFIIMERNIFLIFLGALLLAVIFAFFFSFILAEKVTKPIKSIIEATTKVSDGKLDFRVDSESTVRELDKLAESFNEMEEKLMEREQSLKISNEQLASLNKSYLDLVGFVSHELKGIVATTMLNAYSVRDGFLGMINFKQRKALDAVTRNLDYFDSTVKNFLNLSRLEKDEINISKKELYINEDIFEGAIEDILKPASEKNIEVSNNLEPKLKIFADQNLMLIVANNLVGNAIKYASPDGSLIVSSRISGDYVEIEVYNDGRPITKEEIGKLFKRFSRLDAPETKRAKGTGLGLFITREIVEKQGGSIWVESREKGNSFIIKLERSRENANSDGANKA